MKPYFERMDVFGKALKPGRKNRAEARAEAAKKKRRAEKRAAGEHEDWVKKKDRLRVRLPALTAKPGTAWQPPRFDFSSKEARHVSDGRLGRRAGGGGGYFSFSSTTSAARSSSRSSRRA